jgi:hypothetical protein
MNHEIDLEDALDSITHKEKKIRERITENFEDTMNDLLEKHQETIDRMSVTSQVALSQAELCTQINHDTRELLDTQRQLLDQCQGTSANLDRAWEERSRQSPNAREKQASRKDSRSNNRPYPPRSPEPRIIRESEIQAMTSPATKEKTDSKQETRQKDKKEVEKIALQVLYLSEEAGSEIENEETNRRERRHRQENRVPTSYLPPEMYKGNVDEWIEPWITRFEKYCVEIGLNLEEPEVIDILMNRDLLSPKVAATWDMIEEEDQYNWQIVKDMLLREWSQDNILHNIRIGFMFRKQGEQEDYNTFMHALQVQAHKAWDTNVEDKIKQQFLIGIRDLKVRRQLNNTFEFELIENMHSII